MNCQDIARILDEQEVDGLLAEEQSDVRAHLATCRDCARDWQIHSQLSGAEIPAVPAELRAFYAAQVAGVANVGARRRSRFVVIGALVAVAAAAAMLAVQLTGSAPPIAANVDPPQVESSAPVSGQSLLSAGSESGAADVEQPVAKTEEKSVMASDHPAMLRIVVSLPRYDSPDRTAKPAVEAFHSSLLKALRDTPDVIVDVVSAASAADHSANRVTVVSPRVSLLSSGERIYHSGDGRSTWGEMGGSRGPRLVAVEVMVEPSIQSRPDDSSAAFQFIDDSGTPAGSFCSTRGRALTRSTVPTYAGATPDLDRLMSICSSVSNLAARIVESLRPQPEPPAIDTAQFIARLSDASGSVRDRDAAFSELLRRLRQGGVAFDAAAIDAITTYVGSLPAEQRVTSLTGLRGVRQPVLVVPLLAFLQHDGDEKVRLEALTVLVRDYSSDGRVRTALENVARQDASRLLRMVAQRTLSGDAQWEPYVVATLLDKGLSPTERMAPAQYEAGLANYPEGFEKMQSYLGSREVTSQLLDIFQELRSQPRQSGAGGFRSPGMQGAPTGFQGFQGGSQPQDETMQKVVSLLSMTNPSAAIDLQISILTEDPQSYPRQLSAYALRNLLDTRRRDDPRVVRLLDDIAAGKSGPELRNQLERSLATKPQAIPPQTP